MKTVLTKSLSFILAFTILLMLIPQIVIADTAGDFIYTVSNGNATITEYRGMGGAVTIPSNLGGYPVLSIGNNAFLDNRNITGIIIGNNITSIGEYAFSACIRLENVVISDSVTTIGKNAFEECSALMTIDFGEGITTISDHMLYSCNQLKNVTIGNNVNNIESHAFDYCSSLNDVVIGDNIKSIGDYAFANCTSFYNIKIGNGVTSIGNNAFARDISLSKIEMGSNVETIGDMAFYNCGFTTIDLGEKISYISSSAFYQMYKLLSINVSDNNLVYSSVDGVLFNKEKTTLIKFPEKKNQGVYNIPESVYEIGNNSFHGNVYLNSILLGNHVSLIGDSAFENCWYLNTITMESSVTAIGKNAFYGCSALINFTIGSNVTTIGESAFYSCNKLETVTIGDKVTDIGEYAFGSCRNISSITLGNNVKTIGEKAFYLCFALKTITIPSSVINIGGGAFLYCDALTEIKVDTDNTSYCSVDGVLFNHEKTAIISYPSGKMVATYALPTTVTVISAYAFAGYGGVTEVTAGNGITAIEEYAFSYCYNLKFKAGLQNIVTIGNNAFEYNCVTAVIAGNKLTAIGDSAFIGCYSLSEFNGGTALKTIGDFAFSECQKLAKVTLGNSLISIGASAFYFCANLKTISIYGNSTIGSNAFAACGKITTVIIGDGVKSIGEKAFNGCIVLTNVYFLGNAPTMGQQIFAQTSTALRLYYLANKTGFSTPYWYGKYSEVFPATPKGLKATSLSYNSIKLTWNACNNVDGYVIYKLNVAKNVFEYLTSTSLLSFTHQSLITGTKYYYKIYSYKTLDGKKIAGAISGYVSAIPVLTVPATLTVARASSSSIKLTWAVVAGASGYTIYRYNSSTKLYPALTNTVATYYTNKGLSKGATYYYKVAAYRLVGNVKVYGGLTAVKSAKTY